MHWFRTASTMLCAVGTDDRLVSLYYVLPPLQGADDRVRAEGVRLSNAVASASNRRADAYEVYTELGSARAENPYSHVVEFKLPARDVKAMETVLQQRYLGGDDGFRSVKAGRLYVKEDIPVSRLAEIHPPRRSMMDGIYATGGDAGGYEGGAPSGLRKAEQLAALSSLVNVHDGLSLGADRLERYIENFHFGTLAQSRHDHEKVNFYNNHYGTRTHADILASVPETAESLRAKRGLEHKAKQTFYDLAGGIARVGEFAGGIEAFAKTAEIEDVQSYVSQALDALDRVEDSGKIGSTSSCPDLGRAADSCKEAEQSSEDLIENVVLAHVNLHEMTRQRFGEMAEYDRHSEDRITASKSRSILFEFVNALLGDADKYETSPGEEGSKYYDGPTINRPRD